MGGRYIDPAALFKPVTLQGRYIDLQPLAETHVPGLSSVGLDPVIWQFMRYKPVRTEADMRAWVQDMLHRQAGGHDLPFVMIHLETGAPVGVTRYMEFHPADRNVEIGGTWVGVGFQRTQVNTESKYLLFRHAFEQLGMIRVFLKTDLRNQRSQQAIERLGAVKEGVIRNHIILPDGTIRSSVFYSILVEEWPEVRRKLEAKLYP